MANASVFRSIFGWMMGFVFLVWVWTVALIMAWPWNKTSAWEPELRLVATCANGEGCSVPYGDLAAAKAKGVYTSLTPPELIGEVAEPDGWLYWRTETGKPWQYEVKRSSWDFQVIVRYRFDGATPVLVEYNRFDGRVFTYAIPLALLMVGGLYLRTLRN